MVKIKPLMEFFEFEFIFSLEKFGIQIFSVDFGII